MLFREATVSFRKPDVLARRYSSPFLYALAKKFFTIRDNYHPNGFVFDHLWIEFPDGSASWNARSSVGCYMPPRKAMSHFNYLKSEKCKIEVIDRIVEAHQRDELNLESLCADGKLISNQLSVASVGEFRQQLRAARSILRACFFKSSDFFDDPFVGLQSYLDEMRKETYDPQERMWRYGGSLRKDITHPEDLGKQQLERARFRIEIECFSKTDQDRIMMAYDFAEEAHRDAKPRKDGSRYFTHPRRTAIRLIRLGETDADTIIAALCHDVGEDTHALQRTNLPEDKPRDTLIQFAAIFKNAQLATVMYSLTKKGHSLEADIPDIQRKINEKTKIEVEAEYYRELRKAPAKAIKIKIFDRLDNLSDIDGFKTEKIMEWLTETVDILMPIFYEREVGREFDTVSRRGLRLLEQEIENIFNRLQKREDIILILN